MYDFSIGTYSKRTGLFTYTVVVLGERPAYNCAVEKENNRRTSNAFSFCTLEV